MRTGFLDDDSIAYHMPFAARFAQQHDITQLQFIAPDQPISFYPANSELLHASLLSLVGNDLLSPLVNLAVLGALILAAWCFGERFGRSHLCVAVVGVLAASPLYTSHFAGTALVDLLGITFLCAAVVVLLRYPQPGRVAGGGRVGSRHRARHEVHPRRAGGPPHRGRHRALRSALAAHGGLVGRARRLRLGLVRAEPGARGEPRASRRASACGPIVLEKTEFAISEYSHSVASYLTDPTAVRDVYGPGITSAFGRLWPVVLALVVLGAIGAVIAGRDRVHRAIGLVAVGSLLAYLLTPGAALGFGPLPDLVYFSSAVRYGGPATALGLLLVPTLPLLDRRWAQRALLGLALGDAPRGPPDLAHPLVGVAPRCQPDPGLMAAVGVVAVGWLFARNRSPGAPDRTGRPSAVCARCSCSGSPTSDGRIGTTRTGTTSIDCTRGRSRSATPGSRTAGFFQVYALHGARREQPRAAHRPGRSSGFVPGGRSAARRGWTSWPRATTTRGRCSVRPRIARSQRRPPGPSRSPRPRSPSKPAR